MELDTMRLPTVTYKPGYTVTLLEHEDNITFICQRLLPDVDTGEPRYLTFTRTLPLERALDDHMLRWWIRENIIAMESHEINEWLHIDGVRVVDPHRDDRR